MPEREVPQRAKEQQQAETIEFRFQMIKWWTILAILGGSGVMAINGDLLAIPTAGTAEIARRRFNRLHQDYEVKSEAEVRNLPEPEPTLAELVSRT